MLIFNEEGAGYQGYPGIDWLEKGGTDLARCEALLLLLHLPAQGPLVVAPEGEHLHKDNGFQQ